MEANNFKLREALDAILQIANGDMQRYCPHSEADRDAILAWANLIVSLAQSALAAPARNYDVGTADEQTERFHKFCLSHTQKKKAKSVKIGFKKVVPDAVLPKYAHEGDVGMDVCAAEDKVLQLFSPTLVRTGLVADIPAGYELQVRPRSGLSLKGVTVWNTPGSIDAGYRGEIGVILFAAQGSQSSWSESRVWRDEFAVHKGDRIAQLVVAPVMRCEPVEVQEVGDDTERGTGGFGSTGI